jgi:hypothetical protein
MIHRRQLGTLLGLALLCVVLSFMSPYFLTISNLLNVAQQASINAIIAAGMTFVIISAGIDLSVGSILAFSGVVMASALQAGAPAILAIPAGLATGAACGVEDATVERFDDLDDELNDRGRRVEDAAFLALCEGELTEEVLVDAAEGVEVRGGRDLGDLLEQLLEQRAGEEVEGLGQHAGEPRVVLLDLAHRRVDLSADLLALGQG